MNTHEYQAKSVLAKYGVPVSSFKVVKTVGEAERALEELGIDAAVVKVQVHAGGRGKAGGVKIGKNRDEVLDHVRHMLGLHIVNNQTGPLGVIAHEVMVSTLTDIKKEFYMGAIIDRDKGYASLIVSPEGGMEIEEIAEKTPEKIRMFPISLDGKLRLYQLEQIVKFMGWEGEVAKKGKKVAMAVAKAFVDSDASLLEVNPLVETPTGELIALDAKLSIDDNALFRHPDIAAFYDATQVPSNEARAKTFDLAYIALDGDIGCMVNGAGLAMATMDIIQYYGGAPANFLDVGGGASEEKVAEGFKIILSDPNVKAILVNIFGGIMNCETLASGVVSAVKDIGLTVPLVVRMEGTNVQNGKKKLIDSQLNIVVADGLADAAEKVVAAAREEQWHF